MISPARSITTSWQSLGLLGTGGFATVHKMKHPLDGMEYAVKQIPLRLDEVEEAVSVLQEIRILARLHHTNIVRYYNAWVEPSPPTTGDEEPAPYMCFIQMELCQMSLREYLDKRTTVDYTSSSDIFRQALRGIKHLHDHGVLHCDLKPDNIMLGIDEKNGRMTVKLTDFGMATVWRDRTLAVAIAVAEESLLATTAGNCAGGTETYMPHLDQDEARTSAYDVYALGIILMELLMIFYTAMERYVVIKRLKSPMRVVPPSIEKEYPVEGVLIQGMVSPDPDHRPRIHALLSYFETCSGHLLLCRDIVWEIIYDSVG